MAQASLSLRRISFTWPSGSAPIVADLTATFAPGFTGIIGANGVGKTTLLKLATRELTPDAGEIDAPGPAHYCEQRTDTRPANLEAMLEDTGAPVYALRARLAIGGDWAERWDSLSHGERKRAQIG